MQQKELDSIVVKKEDVENLENFFKYFDMKPSSDLRSSMDKFTNNPDDFSLEDQEDFRIALAGFITTSDHPLFNFNDKIKEVTANISKNLSEITVSRDLKKALEE